MLLLLLLLLLLPARYCFGRPVQLGFLITCLVVLLSGLGPGWSTYFQ